MKKWFLVLLLLAPVLARSILDRVRIFQQDGLTGSIVYAENRTQADITITMSLINLVNIKPPKPVTRTIPGGRQIELFRIRPAGPGGWRYQYKYRFTWGSLHAKHDPKTVYRLPFEGKRRVVQGFHGKFSHRGELAYAVDFEMPQGTPVLAAREGEVVFTESSYTLGGVDKALWTQANEVLVRHFDGTLATYAHLQPGGVAVQVGQHVQPGEVLGYSGNTGYTSGPHLHFMVFKAKNGSARLSFPVRFQTSKGVVTPKEGASYSP